MWNVVRILHQHFYDAHTHAHTRRHINQLSPQATQIQVQQMWRGTMLHDFIQIQCSKIRTIIV